jgi:hypothetical protein
MLGTPWNATGYFSGFSFSTVGDFGSGGGAGSGESVGAL